MTEPENVPLSVLDHRPQLMILQQQYPIVGYAVRAFRNCGGLVSEMHQTERIDDHIRKFVICGYVEPSVGNQLQP